MKMINNYKNPYKKEPNLDNIVDQLASRLQEIKDSEGTSQAGMPTCSFERAEAVRRYYAAFPALTKGQESPQQYYLPPPAWCRKTANDDKMQSESSISKDWNVKSKKFPNGKERRNSHQGQKKNRKRCNGHDRALETHESLPEWVTHEGVWDMESQDPVREFIRAIALDEGYGTCENTIADDGAPASRAPPVPDWDDELDLHGDWVLGDDAPRDPDPLEDELYAKFEAKFDRSIEALWARDDTPDDHYQELPIDFAELLASPSDRAFDPPPAAGTPSPPPSPPLHDRLRPLHLASPPPELHSFALYGDGDELYRALAAVADSVRSLTAINHSRDTSGFAEVPPRARLALPPPPAPRPPPGWFGPVTPARDSDDPLTSTRTHFRPIRHESETEAPRYADGDTFDISGELEAVEFRRSDSGGAYLGAGAARVRYLEYRAEERSRGIDYGRLALTRAQQECEAEGGSALPLRFPLRQTDAAAQTDGWPACDECAGAAKKMRPDAGIWSSPRACRACAPPPPPVGGAAGGGAEELSRDWEELLADISAAHAQYAAAGEEESAWRDEPADRKRRHSAALRCARHCAHPHARFLPCCALDRPLTR